MSLPASAIPAMSSSQLAPPLNSKRRYAKFTPTIWHDTFSKYADSESLEVNDTMKQELQMHRKKVKMYLSSGDNNVSQKLSLIDSIQRLSMSYHFKTEIDEALAQIHNDFTKNVLTTEEYRDIHFVSLLFRLLRQKGYWISSDVFNKFKNEKGEFDEIIVVQDVQGLWSLYEAAQLRIHGEDILEEANEFTYNKLKSITNQLSSSLADQINQSIGQPLYKAIPRMRARSYMSFYKETPSHDDVLLSFAKLDFNMLQKWYRKEVGIITKWWRESDFATKVPYARDRVVEVFTWPYAMNSEPKYSTARLMTTKVTACLSLLDDTYDIYGTVEELELLTEAIQRWDISYIASLPECFKVVFNAILDIWDEMESLTAENGDSSYVLQHLKQIFSKLARAYLVEEKWCHEGHIPTYDEYKVNGVQTSAFPVMLSVFIASVKEFATKEILDWFSNVPAILEATSLICRIINDLASHKFEQQRAHVASAVECCMKQYGLSQEEAYEFINKDISYYWKNINEEYLKLIKDMPEPLLDLFVNLARISEFMYANFEDRYTNCRLLKDHIVALLLDPIV